MLEDLTKMEATEEKAGMHEMALLARQEMEGIIERLHSLEGDLKHAVLPPDEADDGCAMIEIRAGTGGDEAGLFAAEMLEMYQNYSISQGWEFDLVSSSTDAHSIRVAIN